VEKIYPKMYSLEQERYKSDTPKNWNFWNNSSGYTWSWTKFKAYSPYSDKSANINQTQINNAMNFSKAILDKPNKYNDYFEKSTDLHITPLWKIIWQAHNSYIIVETSSWIKFLDQHALAERIIYEKLIKNDYKHNIQWLLIWESISLTPKEINILEENKIIFIDMWFDFETMPWNIVIINWIPDFIKKENISEIFIWIIDDIWNQNFTKSTTLEEVKNKIFAYTSCRSAIKFWHKLNLFEMNKLLNDSIINYSSTCPHWRPVIFEIGLDELKDKYER
jgi:DNA mismatch repair protein MutL